MGRVRSWGEGEEEGGETKHLASFKMKFLKYLFSIYLMAVERT